MKIYVGNLPYQTMDDELRKAFEPYGAVETAEVVIDRMTNRSRGFGFVTMPNDAEGAAAVDALNGTELGGRKLRVDRSQPRERSYR